MASFEGALRALNEMKRDGVLRDYAVAGAMALVFWSEPIPTYDLDVLVWLPEQERAMLLTTLDRIYAWAVERGYPVEAEHVLIEGVPVQFLPAHNALADEAIQTAAVLEYAGIPVRVVRPQYLIALYLEPTARTRKRVERALALAESPSIEPEELAQLLNRFGLQW